MGLCTSRKVGPAETGDSLQDQHGEGTPTPVQAQPTASQPTGSPNPDVGQDQESDQESLTEREPLFKPKYDFPTGVAVSEEGEIFVANSIKKRILVLNLQEVRVHKFPEMTFKLNLPGILADSDSDDQTTEPETLVRQFPTVVPGDQEMIPHDVAIDGEGNVWVVGDTESTNFAVQYDKQGKVLRTIDLKEKANGRFRGVAVDTKRNHILVTQTFRGPHGEVQVFKPDGTLVKRIVGEREKMYRPVYITVDREGNILVSDNYAQCVHVYNEDGQFLFQFGGMGFNDGQLIDPWGICTDSSGNVIVTDSFNCRVQMFDKTGRFIKHIATYLKRPQAVAMTPQGQLVIIDSWGPNVTLHDNLAMSTIGGKGDRPGQFDTPTGVAVSEEGEIFVADKKNWRIQVFTLQGTFVRQFRTVVPAFGDIISPSDVALDGEGNVWVVGKLFNLEGNMARYSGEQWAQQYNKEGRGLTDFRLEHTLWDTGVTVDTRRGYMLVTHKTTGEWPHTRQMQSVQAFNPQNGMIARMIPLRETSDRPKHITVNGEGNILVTNQSLVGQSCVYAYNYCVDKDVNLYHALFGELLFQFGGPESGEGQLNSPSGICTDKSGNIIVTNCDRMENDVTDINRKEACVKMFDKTGRFLKDIATGLGLPCAVAMAPQGQLVVVDAADHKVIVFENY